MGLHRGIAALAGGLILAFATAQAQAADIKVFSSTALKAVLDELGPQFEKATGNKLVFTIGPAATMKSQIDQGAAFDVAIVTPPLLAALATAHKVDPATRAVIARSALGVSVRAGAPKPDVGTADALKRALLNAKTIGFNGQGASRAGIEAMFAKLGIAEDLKPKIKLLQTSAPVAVASGEVEMALSPISEVVAVSGAQLAGPVPAEYQSYLVLSGAVAADSKNAAASGALIKFLTAPSAAPVLKAKGMEPG
ncbi:MAG TPA: extracellular solute-binding protein [Xanthobacteraceae bacterium]|jgi:molybdate transport system substrate-binding protein|nr:extracellular solute-binding protein [Xanthobacteraceae bacterium]